VSAVDNSNLFISMTARCITGGRCCDCVAVNVPAAAHEEESDGTKGGLLRKWSVN